MCDKFNVAVGVVRKGVAIQLSQVVVDVAVVGRAEVDPLQDILVAEAVVVSFSFFESQEL